MNQYWMQNSTINKACAPKEHQFFLHLKTTGFSKKQTVSIWQKMWNTMRYTVGMLTFFLWSGGKCIYV